MPLEPKRSPVAPAVFHQNLACTQVETWIVIPVLLVGIGLLSAVVLCRWADGRLAHHDANPDDARAESDDGPRSAERRNGVGESCTGSARRAGAVTAQDR